MFLKLFIAFLLVILSVRFYFFFQKGDTYKDGQKIRYETTIFSEPQSNSTIQKIDVNLPTGENVYITLPRFPEYNYGDRIIISGPIRILPRHGGGQSYGASTRIFSLLFNKQQYIFSQNFPKIEYVKTDKDLILAVITFIRQRVLGVFNNALPPDLASLLLGIVFGIKAPMSNSFFNSLKLSGVLHIIAASGMNVTMVGGFLSSFFIIFFKRQTAVILSIFGIIFYAFLAGFSASIVRASIMGILVFSSQILGRQSFASYGLFVTAFIMLFISPNLIFDIGFQLSFTATAGLLYIRPLFDFKNLKKIPLSEDVLITLSAQIATLPILLATFGTYSMWSVVVNGLVLWTVPILMVFGGLGAVFGLVIEPIGKIFLYLCLPFLLYFGQIVSFFSKGALFSLETLPFSFVLGYYFLLLSAILYRKTK